MLGTKCRLHDLEGDDRGIVHLPPPILLRDLAATKDELYRVVDVILSPPGSPIGALVKVQPTHLHVVAA